MKEQLKEQKKRESKTERKSTETSKPSDEQKISNSALMKDIEEVENRVKK